jgi:hypothetical protein
MFWHFCLKMVQQRNYAISFQLCLLFIALLCGCVSVNVAQPTTNHHIALPKESEIGTPSAEKVPRSFWIKLTLGAIIRWGRRDVDSIKNETNEFFHTVTSGFHDGISQMVKFSIVMFNCSIVSSTHFINSTTKTTNKSNGSEAEDFIVPADGDGGGFFQSNNAARDSQCEDLSIIILKVLKAVVIGIAVAILTALLLPLFLRLLLFVIGLTAYGITNFFLY